MKRRLLLFQLRVHLQAAATAFLRTGLRVPRPSGSAAAGTAASRDLPDLTTLRRIPRIEDQVRVKVV